MATLLELFPARVPIGHVTVDGRQVPVLAGQEFLRALGSVLDRLGGPVGPSITDLATADDEDSGMEEFRHESTKALEALAMVPVQSFPQAEDAMHPLAQEFPRYEDPMHPLQQPFPDVQQLMTEVSELREEVARVRSQINDIQQGTDL